MTPAGDEPPPTWEDVVDTALDAQCVMARYLSRIDEGDAEWETLAEIFPRMVAIVRRLESFRP